MQRVNAKSVLYVVGLLGSLAFLGYTLRGTQSGTSGKAGARAEAAAAQEAGARGREGRMVQAAPSDAALSRYGSVIARNIFSPPALLEAREGGLPPIRTTSVRQPVIVPPIHPRPPEPKEPEPQSLADWKYVGYYRINGVMKGVLQNDNNNSAKDLAKGESYLGYTVESVTRQAMVLVAGKTRVTMAIPETFSVVALQGMTGQPQPARAGPGGMRPGGGPGPGMGMRGGG